jgi:EAL domain-containing protein (putative c-di-GMP-specific phosphodiesterase class I)
MGHKLGHCVIAEGVEHESQRQYLIENQCDKMQGFLFSRPVSEEEALQLLLNYPDLHQ